MKKRSILLTAFTAAFALSAGAFAAFGGVKADLPSKVSANDNNISYWRQYFDIESEGDVIVTSSAAKPNYLASVTSPLGGEDVSSGLGVTFYDDVTITYKKPIDARALTSTDALLEFYANPTTQADKTKVTNSSAEDREFNSVNVVLRGVQNPSQYIRINVIPSSANENNANISWGKVETDQMMLGGVKKGNLDTTATLGSPLNSGGFLGLSNKSMVLAYDYNSSTVYGYNRLYGDIDGNILRNLRNPAHLQGSDKMFEGFDGGYVTVSVSFSDLSSQSDPGHVIINKICGQSLNGATFEDTVAPRLVFPSDIDKNDIPVGEVGTMYPFWDITATDVVDGDISDKITHTVTYLGEDGNGTTPVSFNEADGGFVPASQGYYKVVTSVADANGNKATDIVTTFEVYPVVDVIEFKIDSSIPLNASVGDVVSIPSYTVKGGSGTVRVNVSASFGDRAESLSVSSGSIQLTKAGVYKITYVVSDYLGTEKVYDYPIYTQLSAKPIISKTVIPEIWKANNDIALNLPKAYDYNSIPGQKTEVPVKIYVAKQLSGVKGEFTEVTANAKGEYIVPANVNLEKIFVKYVSTSLVGNETAESEEFEIKYIKPETLADYFVNLDGKITSAYEDITTTYTTYENVFTVNENGATLKFLNPLLASGYKMRLNFFKDTAFFKKISIKLTDSVNPDEVVTFTLTKKNDTDVYISTVENSFTSVAGQMNNLTTAYDNVFFKFKLGNVLVDSNGTDLYSITKYDNGYEFKKFTSNKVYVEIKFDEIDTSAGKVNKVNISEFYTQNKFGATKFEDESGNVTDIVYNSDSALPSIQTASHIDAYYNYLEEATIPTAKAYDTFSPNCEVFVSVKAPDGSYVLGSLTQGVSANEEHKILLDQVGRYEVKYTSKDEDHGNRVTSFSKIINTLDIVNPTIEINGQIKTNYKVGNVLQIPEYFVSDNITAEGDMLSYVYLQTPSFGYKTICANGNKGTYKFQKKGTYVLTFYAMDKASNVTTKSFVLTVTD